ncbi:Kazal-type serine protease inhibitor domain-containing protein [Chelativorans intermedius]|uniref:Kazal-type serine protease inhibitor domain-containing protein n=1 Tax=Chelativorans intermedius TaxID=515947 RepID=A0ABV6D6G5_9HYPH|nr:Kazal-type serine protease inhibitor domain-containing protein [Chelativorans intermedius]MCT8998293.1 Kazal-type serine protease inhibitor domain-containing protein [Chelativorans intermedius]
MKVFKSSAGIAAALAGAILAACTVVVEEGVGSYPPPRPQVCTQEYAPVCARRGERQRTFSNACRAQAEGYRPVYSGACRPQSSRPQRPQACTREYNPVCARRGSRFRTFPNACEARAADHRIVKPGAC